MELILGNYIFCYFAYLLLMKWFTYKNVYIDGCLSQLYMYVSLDIIIYSKTD